MDFYKLAAPQDPNYREDGSGSDDDYYGDWRWILILFGIGAFLTWLGSC